VIERSFIILPGIGPKNEQRLWANGIDSWDSLLFRKRIKGLSDERMERYRQIAKQIINLQSKGMIHEIGMMLPKKETWRLLGSWDSRYIAMDAECVKIQGISSPVIVSVYRGFDRPVTLLRGDDLCWKNLKELIRGGQYLVTFNGSSFDMPMLERWGYSPDNIMHIDLRRFAQRAGLTGGLKSIERKLGIVRSRELEFSTERQVSYLWRLWEEKGSKNALDLLVRYNVQDTTTLRSLSKEIYDRLRNDAMEEYHTGIRRGDVHWTL